MFDRHIYVPVGGSRHGLLRQIIASFLCFVFIFVWHGMNYGILIWTILNYLGILLEAMASQVSTIPSVKAFEVKSFYMRHHSRIVQVYSQHKTKMVALVNFSKAMDANRVLLQVSIMCNKTL